MTTKRKREIVDLEDGAKILEIHPETMRVMVREGRIETIDPDVNPTPPYFFDADYLRSLPKIQRGRPRKSNMKGGD
jgi:hypothetical protein